MRGKWSTTIVVVISALLCVANASAQLSDLVDPIERDAVMRPPGGVDDGDGDDGLGFGKKIAGAWLGAGSFSVDLGCDGSFDIGPIPFTDSQLFGIKGDHVVTNPANPNTNLGTWAKIGNRQISSRDISFAVDVTPGGSVTTVAVVTMIADFDADYQTATTMFGAKVYLPFQDPLDPGEAPVACSQGQHDSFRKVTATE